MRHCHMINIETDTGTTRIKLLDNSFVNEWKEHFIFMLNNAHIGTTKQMHKITSLPYLVSDFECCDSWVLTKRVAELKELIEELNTFVTFPVSIDHIDDVLLNDTKLNFQHLLNEMHRHCTTALTVLRNNTHTSKLFASTGRLHWGNVHGDPTIIGSMNNVEFTISNDDVDKFAILMEKINLGVHAVESRVPTPNKLNDWTNPDPDNPDPISKERADRFEVTFDFVEPQVLDLTEDKKVFFKQTIDYQTLEYMSDSDDYDVWMAFDILGKNYQEAYYDHDDPTEWDVTHSLGHSGGFLVNLTDTTDQTLIKSDKMQDWFKSYNIEYTPMMNNYPLGNVIEGKKYLQNTMKCIITHDG